MRILPSRSEERVLRVTPLRAGILLAATSLTLASCASEPEIVTVTETVTAWAEKPTVTSTRSTTSSATPTPATDTTTEPRETTTIETTTGQTTTRAAAADGTPREFRAAVDKAVSYNSMSGFSKQGLYEQLLFEGFPEAAAQYGVDNVSADWSVNALRTANSYLETSAFSDTGLYDQLLFGGFTPEQASYALANL